jgi:hypothetical protein
MFNAPDALKDKCGSDPNPPLLTKRFQQSHIPSELWI